MTKYISWDPGGSSTARSTGRTLWNEEANPEEMRSLTEEEFDRELERTPGTVEVFIIEEYRPYGHVNHTGDKLLTAQRIGDIKGYARRRGIKVVEVPANIKKIAAKWAQMKIDWSKHIPDWQASFLIGYWWLFREGLIKPKVLDS